MSERQEPPAHEALDRMLRGVRFAPRASLGPELLGRVRRGERSKGAVASWGIRRALLALAAGAVAAGVIGAVAVMRYRAALGTSVWVTAVPVPIVVDRCCYDLDGGGRADDGVRLVTEPNARVHRLWLYEDRDHSGGYTPADLVRLERGDLPAFRTGAVSRRLVTIRHCCLDFDGGGPADDGVLVLGTPPDRVVMAAIYERSRDSVGPADVALR